MNAKSRLLSLILAIVLVFSTINTIGFAATYSDVDKTKSYSSAVSLLSALKLLKGYEDGTFKPDGDITRAEFAAVVVRALGQEESATAAQGTTTFDDVKSDFWGSGYITVASNLKIISGFGDGNFGPEQNVTYEQAVKMMVCALGYEPLALSAVNDDATQVWPKGYLAAASQLNILNGVQGVEGSPAKRWQVARLVYNSLEVKIMEKVVSVTGDVKYEKKDKTLLKDSLKIENSTGEIRANTTTSVSANTAKTRNGEVLIYDDNEKEEVTYKDGSISTDGMVGHAVKFYYTKTDDDIRTLVYIEDKTSSSDILKIDADDIEKIDGSDIYYWEDKETSTKTTKVTLADNVSVTVNGRVVSKPTKDDLMPLSGTIELIDSTGAGNFDKVLVTSYETYVVKSINSTGKEIVDKYRTLSDKNSIKIDEDDNSIDVSIKNTSGSKLTFSNIAVWNVLSIKQNSGSSKNTMEVTVSNKVITGTITEVDEDAISIDNKKYEISKYYKKYAEKSADYVKFEVDLSGKFYLDKDDKIAAFDKTASANSYYGYLRRAVFEKDKLNLEILSQNDSALKVYTGASKVKIDGVSKDDDNVEDALKNIALYNEYINTDDHGDRNGDGKIDDEDKDRAEVFNTKGYAPQLIRFSLNSSNQVNVIQTVDKDLDVLDLGYSKTTDDVNKMQFNNSNKQFTGIGSNTDKKFIVNSSTVVFIVPNDRTSKDDYSKSTYSYFDDMEKYSIEAYDTVKSGDIITAKAVVVYVSKFDKEPNAKSPVAFVTKIKSATNSTDSDYNRIISAYVVGSGITPQDQTVELWAQGGDADSLNIGDVIRYNTTTTGFIVPESVRKVYDLSSSMKDVYITATAGTLNLLLYNGYLSSSSEGIIEVAHTTDLKKIKDSDKKTFTIGNNAAKFVYNVSENPVIQKSNIDLDTCNSYSNSADKDNPDATEILVFTLDGTVYAVYVIEKR